MEPVWQLLNAKINDDDWNAKHKAGLRSAAAGRQFTQARVMRCGWADHDRCLVCLNNLVEKESPYVEEKKRTIRDPVVATSDQLLRGLVILLIACGPVAASKPSGIKKRVRMT